MTDEPLVKVTEAASYLDVSTKTVYRLVAAGELPCRRVGRQLRFEPAVLRAHSSTPAEPAPAAEIGAFRVALSALSYDAT